jgi:hypothetical protein
MNNEAPSGPVPSASASASESASVQSNQAVPSPAVPAGWYLYPATGRQRYWDGANWTEHYAPVSPPPRPRKSNAPFVLGIIGIVLAFIPGALYIGIVLGVLAVIFGIIAMRARIPRGTVGLALGIVAILIGSLFASIYGNVSASSTDSSDSLPLVAPKTVPSDKATPTTETTPPAPAPAKPAVKALTASQEQAAIAADGYLTDGQGFSYKGLLRQLTSKYGDGFPRADAIVAIKSLNPVWSRQAVISAKGYLSDGGGFSHNSLLQQLTSPYGEQFTKSEALYALKKVGL